MAWCPKCKNEFIDGITHCTECNVELVDELVEEKDLEYIYLNSVMELIDDIEDLIDYLHKASIDSAEFVYLNDKETEAIAVEKKQYSDARLHLSVYIQNESAKNLMAMEQDEYAENIDEEAISEEEIDNDASTYEDSEILDSSDSESKEALALLAPKKGAAYTKLSDKYEDVKSSGYTLLIVGLLGIVALILEATGVFTLSLPESTKWLSYTVMGGIFIAFIISGVYSLKRSVQLKIDAEKEDIIIEEINAWFLENHTKESIDAEIETDTQEELLYFNRADFIKNVIMHRFEEVDEALVDFLVEPLYTDLYEQTKNDE